MSAVLMRATWLHRALLNPRGTHVSRTSIQNSSIQEGYYGRRTESGSKSAMPSRIIRGLDRHRLVQERDGVVKISNA